MKMSEWKDFWQTAGIIASIVIGIFGAAKIFVELRRIKEQRAKEISDQAAAGLLKRADFLLTQHRRLFDNSDLYEILCLIDSDNPCLKEQDMWDKKRKFLTFFEEIELLIQSNLVDRNVAYYMFGYYAYTAHDGVNFQEGIDLLPAYWALFFNFSISARAYVQNSGTTTAGSLKF